MNVGFRPVAVRSFRIEDKLGCYDVHLDADLVERMAGPPALIRLPADQPRFELTAGDVLVIDPAGVPYDGDLIVGELQEFRLVSRVRVRRGVVLLDDGRSRLRSLAHHKLEFEGVVVLLIRSLRPAGAVNEPTPAA